MPIVDPSGSRFRLESLFRPQSVAVVGADSEAGQVALGNLLRGGFKGPILPVAAARAVLGVLAYPDVASLPLVPDLTLLASSAPEVTEAALMALGKLGGRVAVALGPMPDLGAIAKASGVRVLGPGSFGVAVPEIGLNASLSHIPPMPGKLAFVTQSAALGRAVLDWAGPNGVGFSHIVGIGGNADLGFGLVLDWLSRDPGTRAILLDIRHIRDRRIFFSAARAAARMRPVVAIRAGSWARDPSGRAGLVFEAALRRVGVLAVTRLDDVLAAALTLSRARPVRNETLAIVTNATGPAQLAADAVLRGGVKLFSPSAEIAAMLEKLLGVRVTEEGMIYVGWNQPTRLAEAASALAGLPEVGGVLAVMTPTGDADRVAIEGLIACAGTMKLPLLVCAMGESTGARHRRRLAQAGLPAFAVPEQAVQGFLHLLQDRRNRAAARELPSSQMVRVLPDREKAEAIWRRTGQVLDDDELGTLLVAYGIDVAAWPEHLVVEVFDDGLAGPAIGVGMAQEGMDYDLLPLNLPLAESLVAHRRTMPAEVAPILVRISQMVVDWGRIAGLSLARGEARIVLRPVGEKAFFALPPYPEELSEAWNGLAIRPIRPEDAEAHAAFFGRLGPDDVRYRFFAALRSLSPEGIARLTQVDYDREIAFIAEREAGVTVGVSRLVCDPATKYAEFAVVVEPSTKGRGLARRLMEKLFEWGREHGVVRITGQILSDNQPMLGFVRRLGFEVRQIPDDQTVVEAVYDLAGEGAEGFLQQP